MNDAAVLVGLAALVLAAMIGAGRRRQGAPIPAEFIPREEAPAVQWRASIDGAAMFFVQQRG